MSKPELFKVVFQTGGTSLCNTGNSGNLVVAAD